MTAPLLVMEDVERRYRLPRESLFAPRPALRAVDGVSLIVDPGEAVGIVGESGSGKSTLARLAMAFERPDAGTVRFQGQDLATVAPKRLRELRRGFQMVFQDPSASLDPRRTAGWSVGEPLLSDRSVTASQRAERVRLAFDRVGLPTAALERYPHQFSGGQRQRIAIARAVVTEPALIVADEPVASLDVSVQAQILNLLMDLQDEFGMALLFISHDLAVVATLCDRIAVMRSGKIVETAATRTLVTSPRHPYTRSLFATA